MTSPMHRSEGKVTTALYADDKKIINCIGSETRLLGITDNSFKHGTLK